MVNFLIVDDHDIIREGIKNLLETKTAYNVINTLSSGEEAYRFCTGQLEQPIDIILMDITMEGYGGLEASKRILKRNPKQKIIIMTMHDNPVLIDQAIHIGVLGFVSKNALTHDLFAAIEFAINKRIFISPKLKANIENKKSYDKKLASLTSRELDILKMIASGDKMEKVAETLFISKKTVANNLAIIKSKLDIETDYELFSLTLKNNIVI
jgi:two-component system invasion response regulator UvrY